MRRPRTAVLLALVGLGLALAPASIAAAAPKEERRAKSVPKKRIITSCPAFHQVRVGNEGLRFELHNTCSFPVACTMTWAVHCRGRGESPGERSGNLELAVGASDSVLASGDACGPDGWDIDGIRWSCDPRPGGRDKSSEAKDGELRRMAGYCDCASPTSYASPRRARTDERIRIKRMRSAAGVSPNSAANVFPLTLPT